MYVPLGTVCTDNFEFVMANVCLFFACLRSFVQDSSGTLTAETPLLFISAVPTIKPKR